MQEKDVNDTCYYENSYSILWQVDRVKVVSAMEWPRPSDHRSGSITSLGKVWWTTRALCMNWSPTFCLSVNQVYTPWLVCSLWQMMMNQSSLCDLCLCICLCKRYSVAIATFSIMPQLDSTGRVCNWACDEWDVRDYLAHFNTPEEETTDLNISASRSNQSR